jgi:hypothetical protein
VGQHAHSSRGATIGAHRPAALLRNGDPSRRAYASRQLRNGIGGNLATPPLPQERGTCSRRRGGRRGFLMRTSAPALRSLHCRAVGLHRSALACRTDNTDCLPHGVFEMRVSTPHFQPFGPSADAPAHYAIMLGTQAESPLHERASA